MNKIKFNNEVLKKKITSPDKPILWINNITFNTSDNNWTDRLYNASLSFEITCIDKNNDKKKSSGNILTLGEFIEPSTSSPTLDIDKLLYFETLNSFTKDNECQYWVTTFELDDFILKEGETLEVSVADRDYILNRVENWRNKINNLYNKINYWLENSSYSLRIGESINLNKELVKIYDLDIADIYTADIVKNGKIILSFKPVDFWVFGAKGRMDIISSKGSYMLIDYGEQEAKWFIYSQTNGGIRFDKDVLLDLLNQ